MTHNTSRQFLVPAFVVSAGLHALMLFGLQELPAPVHRSAAPSLTATVMMPSLATSPMKQVVPEKTIAGQNLQREKQVREAPSEPVRREKTALRPSPAADASAKSSAPVIDETVDVSRPAAGMVSAVSPGLPDQGKPDAVAANVDSLRQYRLDLALAAQRFRVYPVQARTRGWEGVATISLSSTAIGPVPVLKVTRSSGHAVLDDQALQMLSRAVENTPLPENLRGHRFDMVIPIRFSLGD